MADLRKMLDKAISLTKQQPPGREFEVKMLFSGTEWDELDVGEKRQLGILYSKEYKEGRLPGIQRIENNRQHHSVYRKQ